MTRHRLAFGCRLLLTSAALWALSGCAGDGPPPPDSSSSFDVIQRNIFDVSCVTGPCHSSAARQGNLVLEAGVSYANLVGVSAFNTAANAAGLRRVVPGNADASFLLIKLTGPPAIEGSPMPLGLPALAPADIERIRAWILAGAPASTVATATPTASASPTPTDTPPATATDTATPTITRTPTITPTGTLPATATFTTTPTLTPSPSATFTASATASPSPIPTPTFSLASTLPQIQATIFDATCLDLGCHNARDQQGGLVLETGTSYANLVNVAPVNFAALAAGMRRVDPGNPANSFLLTKLQLPTPFDPQFGSRMPSGKDALTAAQLEQIRAWILRGALADESPPP